MREAKRIATPNTASSQMIAEPVRASARIELIDVLRGFAVFGILVANMASYAGLPRDLDAFHGLNFIIVILERFFIEAKFYSLFSFLFGWGMSVQLARAEARGRRFAPLWFRRMLVLLLIGLIHGVFIWSGDILTLYAALGLLLFLFRKRSPRFLLASAVLFLALPIVLNAPGAIMDTVRDNYAQATAFLRTGGEGARATYASGSYNEILQARLADYVGAQSWILYFIGNVFSMMLLGFYVGKRHIFQEIERYRVQTRWVLFAGFIIGALGNALFLASMLWPERIPAGYQRFVTVGIRTVAAPAMMLFYVSGIMLMWQRPSWRERLSPLAPVGRMALTNYLAQSVVATLIFYGYGMGIYGQVGAGFALLLTLIIFYLQIRISGWWLNRYRFGPAEWLWRTLTYGRIQPMGHGKSSASAPGAAFPRITGRRALALIWMGFLIWAALLIVWNDRIEQRAAGPTIDIAQIRARVTATPPVQGRNAGPTTEDTLPVATPDVQPLVYNPSPLAASGDIQALAEAINPDAILDYVRVLTAAPYLGRQAGSAAGYAAGDFIAAEFARLNLQPAGDDGTFFQTFPALSVKLAESPRLVVIEPDGQRIETYRPHIDYTPLAGAYLGSGAAAGEVVWANDCQTADFKQIDVQGKIPLCRDGDARAAGRHALEHGAAGLLLFADPAQRPPDAGLIYQDVWVPIPIPALRVYPSLVADLLAGTGKTVADLSLQFAPLSLNASVEMAVAVADPETRPARNVLGVLPGRDPKLRDEVILVGAPYDSFGEAPDGLIWPGANRVSGLATMLEMAKSWSDLGYIPRRTVLFAAWDAEAGGQLGEEHYLQHPRYPLQNTRAVLLLEDLAAGGGVLVADGTGDIAAQAQAAADSIAGGSTRLSANDRRQAATAPFASHRVDTALLAWAADEQDWAFTARPGDSVEQLQPQKLAQASAVAATTLLALTEGEPDLLDMLAGRAAALLAGNKAAFLATSAAGQQTADGRWFDDIQGLRPQAFSLVPTKTRVHGRDATATVELKLEYAREDELEGVVRNSVYLDTRFVHEGDSWLWAGPNLVESGETAGIRVAYPPGREPIAGLGERLSASYAAMARRLGLPETVEATLQLYPSVEAMRFSTAPSLPRGQEVWIGPGVIKRVYSPAFEEEATLTGDVARLLLAEAGLDEHTAPWLWLGLPALLESEGRPLDEKGPDLAELNEMLASDEIVWNETSAWAASDYLLRRLGWQGLGSFIVALDDACAEPTCANPAVLDSALAATVQLNAEEFAAAWRTSWRTRLAAAQAAVDALMARRTAAALAGDEEKFLATVDTRVPNLLDEERLWFADLAAKGLQDFKLSGKPLVLLQDGRVLAEASLIARLATANDQLGAQFPVLLTPAEEGYRWAGSLPEAVTDDQVTVLYPPGWEDLAQALLEETAVAYPLLAARLGVADPDPLTLKLYDDPAAFRASIAVDYPAVNWAPGWTAPAAAVKLRVEEDVPPGLYRSALARQLARSLMLQQGVSSEWLLKGVSAYLARLIDDGVFERTLAAELNDLLRSARRADQLDLATLPPDQDLAADELPLATTLAWDTIRYLDYAHGWETVLALLQAQASGVDVEAALQASVGQDMASFRTSWAESLAMAHARPAWIDIANAFDGDGANAHVATLAAPEMAGRQAGSPEAERAASYIAERFSEYGLAPAGDDGSYFQQVPITYTTFLSAPVVELLAGDGATNETLTYRQDFITRLPETGGWGQAEGELVWIPGSISEAMDFSGKIAVRAVSDSSPKEATLLRDQGAVGVIFLGRLEGRKDILSKQPLPIDLPPAEATIPVVELTQAGYSRFLEALGITPPQLAKAPPAWPLGVAARLSVDLLPPEPATTANVLALMPGSDPDLAHEVIVVGAHYDHVGDDAGGLAYAGANDNASGVGVLLELARLWQEEGYHPSRSVLFAAWGAQEPGQLGSSYFVEHPIVPLDDIVAALQMDAVGGGSGYYLEAQGTREREGSMLFGIEAAEDLVDGRLKLTAPQQRSDAYDQTRELYVSPFAGLSDQLLYASESDHIPFLRAGVPALLIYWRGANEDNWPSAIADEVDPKRLATSGRMVSVTLMTLAR